MKFKLVENFSPVFNSIEDLKKWVKKRQKGLSPFHNPDAGNVEYNNAVFNHVMGNTSTADFGETTTNADGMGESLNNSVKDIKLNSEDVQYGVHDFNQQAIIFRGTEEECAEFIDDNNLWDDAEIYTITPDDPHYLKEDEEKLTTYYQIWAKGPSDSKYHFQDEYAYLNDLIDEVKGYMSGDADVRVIEVEEDESGNIVKRNGEILFYSDSAVQNINKELFDVATPQETADMFGKKVYSKKENKLYVPTGPVFEATKLSPEEKLEREREKLGNLALKFEAKAEKCLDKNDREAYWYWKDQADKIRRNIGME